jgi:hypothetical protein
MASGACHPRPCPEGLRQRPSRYQRHQSLEVGTEGQGSVTENDVFGLRVVTDCEDQASAFGSPQSIKATIARELGWRATRCVVRSEARPLLPISPTADAWGPGCRLVAREATAERPGGGCAW